MSQLKEPKEILAEIREERPYKHFFDIFTDFNRTGAGYLVQFFNKMDVSGDGFVDLKEIWYGVKIC